MAGNGTSGPAGGHPQSNKRKHIDSDCRQQKLPTLEVKATSALLENLSECFDNPELSDVTLIAGNNRFYVHKILLMQSPVFRVMLTNHRWSDSRQQEVVLQEPPECAMFMKEFLLYFYTGSLTLTVDNLCPMLILANKYSVTSLEKQCEKFAFKLIFSGIKIDYISHLWQLAEQLDHASLSRKCHQCLLLNMDEFISENCLKTLEMCEIKKLLSDTNMVIQEEYSLLLAVLDWLSVPCHAENYTANLKELLTYINFGMMSTGRLQIIEDLRLWTPEETTVVQRHLYDAFKYQAIPFKKRKGNQLSQYDRPRLYIKLDGMEKFSTCINFFVPESELTQGNFDKESTLAYQTFRVPISLSRADVNNTKQWHVKFTNTGNDHSLQISGTSTANEEYGTVEASVLMLKKAQGRKFVKGVMQFRRFSSQMVTSPIGTKAGHIFRVLLPHDAVSVDSPYYHRHVDGRLGYLFHIIMRHYHQDFSEGNVSEAIRLPVLPYGSERRDEFSPGASKPAPLSLSQ